MALTSWTQGIRCHGTGKGELAGTSEGSADADQTETPGRKRLMNSARGIGPQRSIHP